METTEDEQNTEQVEVTVVVDEETTLKLGDIILRIKNEVKLCCFLAIYQLKCSVE